MARHTIVFFVALAVLIAFPAVSGHSITTATLFRNIYSLESLPLVKEETCRQFSSYDRTGGNDDFANYLSWDKGKDGKGTAVLADMDGPGAIIRIWSAHPDGTLKIYLDNSPEPVIDTPFDQFFKDQSLHPIRTTSSGGWISYWPIPYQKHCKVVVEDTPGFHYQVTYQTYKPGTKVETYTKELGSEARAEFQAALRVWQDPLKNYSTAKESLIGTNPEPKQISSPVLISPGRTETVFLAKGPACIDSFQVHFLQKMTPFQLKKLVIRAYWDGEKSPSIESPLPDFFGCGFGEKPFVSLPLILQPNDYTCRFPMPFGKSARIEIVNGGADSALVEVSIGYRTFARLGPNVLYFHAKWNRELTIEGIPYTILLAKGQGHYVGVNMSMHGNRWMMFLEGDELIYVDGEKQPSFNGTGTEDYFNCGWYFNAGPVAQPLHGLTLQNWDWNQIAAYRLQIPDCVPFSKQIAVRIEHGEVCNYSDADYSSTAYFYQKEPHKDFFKLPEPSRINLPRPAVRPIEHSFEAEALSPSATGGKLRMVKWEDITTNYCGTGAPTLEPKQDGASITFRVPIALKDVYQITGYMAKGRDYGKAVCTIDGGLAGRTADLYADVDTTPATPPDGPPTELAQVMLDPGVHYVTLTVAGPNPKGRLPKISVDKLLLISMSPWITDWQVIGPFPDDMGQVFPPEKEGFVPNAQYDGKDGKVTWHPATAQRNGMVMAGEVLKPKDASRAYAFTRVISPDDRETELLLGCVDFDEAWVNGKLVWKKEAWRGAVPDQDRANIKLRKGENTILINFRFADKWGFYGRLRDPLSELRYSTGP